MRDKKMNKKGMTSFFMTLGFLLMLVTGIILYIQPEGRVANWVDWTLFGLTKSQWGSVHILSGFMLLIASFFHLYFNWKPLKHYLYSRAKQGVNLKKEMVISIVATVILVVGAITELPPFSYVLDLGSTLKASWVVEETDEAPLGHAELLSFNSFTEKLKIDKAKALQELESAGIVVQADKDSLEKIAKENNISPLRIYEVIRKFEPKKEEVEVESLTATRVEEILEGKGVGRRDLTWLVAEFKLESGKAERRLEKNKIAFSEGETFHDIADRLKVSPMDIAKVILVKGYTL